MRISRIALLKKYNSGKNIFVGLDIEDIDLSHSHLAGITFVNCYVAGDFKYSNVSYAQFINCNIKTSDFRYADLTYARMEFVSFDAVKFNNAKSKGFIFKDNYFQGEAGFGLKDFNEWIKNSE